MNLEVGKKYYHKQGPRGTVCSVVSIDDKVEYEVLYGPALKRQPQGSCNLRQFERWADGVFEGEDYGRLDGAVIHKTHILLDVSGKPLFRCSEKRTAFYIRKGYVKKIDDDTYQFTNDQTEKKLKLLYDGQFSEFFMAIKNDRCCVCGKNYDLTRHHVVPQRHKKNLPLELRTRLSNILFICTACHKTYEDQQLASNSLDPYVWKNHFVEIMKPQFIPAGWDIISIRNKWAKYAL